MLTFSPKKGAVIIKKVLLSAIANAEHNDGADVDELKVKTICVDKAESLRRVHRARQGPRQHDPEADLPHPRRRRRRQIGKRPWDKKYIRPASALSVNRNWSSKWFANSKHFAPTLKEDIKVREYLKKKLAHASVGKITIERPAKNARITIHSARPGVVIGKKGEDIETLRADLRKMMGGDVGLNIEEIRKPEIDAQLIADSIGAAAREADHVPARDEARDPERDAPGRAGHQDHVRGPPERHRNRPHRVVPRRPRAAAHAARRHRLRLLAKRMTTYGVIGIKVWVFKGEVLAHGAEPASAPALGAGSAEAAASRRSEECCSQLEGNTARSRRAATRALRPSATR